MWVGSSESTTGRQEDYQQEWQTHVSLMVNSPLGGGRKDRFARLPINANGMTHELIDYCKPSIFLLCSAILSALSKVRYWSCSSRGGPFLPRKAYVSEDYSPGPSRESRPSQYSFLKNPRVDPPVRLMKRKPPATSSLPPIFLRLLLVDGNVDVLGRRPLGPPAFTKASQMPPEPVILLVITRQFV